MIRLPQELSMEMIVSLLVALCVAVIFAAVIIDFILFSSQRRVRREQRSLVDTATMTGFFVFFYLILQSGRGYVLPSHAAARISMLAGSLLVIAGCAANLAGRFSLGGNWANHIKIYEGHQLVRSGIYGLVRHPLYASIIMMFYGACLVYLNVLALAAVTLIFVPFVVYRARQEEALLAQQFVEYKLYQDETGMFFPKIITKEAKRL